ncbi:hypothetical protein ACTZGB_17440 [Yersinia bercovieri]|uniref:Uncharacterized protein n=1 Tax=Yersinia bercovieri ATCC 43970 TaxID=349968 RepID=A0ABM9XXU8_YERBE|nr:hypothetical protein yberc0001_30740 [Yersinia bercovieri ATCC 43970]
MSTSFVDNCLKEDDISVIFQIAGVLATLVHLSDLLAAFSHLEIYWVET